MSNHPGYVYVLINPATPNLVKIGKTTKDPEERARELSSATGVPEPFIIIYKAFFQDCTKGEEFVHELLSSKRISNKREFFRVSNTEAINAVIQAEEKIGSSEKNDGDDLMGNSTSGNEMCQEILESADAYLHGYDENILQDEDEAEDLYKKAVKLGCKNGYHRLGEMYYEKHISSESADDLKQAIHYYKDGAKNGDVKSWGNLAVCYGELEEYSNADKCWLNLLTDPAMEGKEDELGYYFYMFMEYMGSAGRRKHHKLMDAIYNSSDIPVDSRSKERFDVLEGFYQEMVRLDREKD